MTKKYFESYLVGERYDNLIKSLAVLGEAPLEHITMLYGVPKLVIERAAAMVGKSNLLETTPPDMCLTDEYYVIPPAPPKETREERIQRINKAVLKYQDCDHERPLVKHHTRCSRCMKILGSELHYLHLNDIEDTVNLTLDELANDDVFENELRYEFTQKLMQNIQRTGEVINVG